MDMLIPTDMGTDIPSIARLIIIGLAYIMLGRSTSGRDMDGIADITVRVTTGPAWYIQGIIEWNVADADRTRRLSVAALSRRRDADNI